jgi:hypothetical protein
MVAVECVATARVVVVLPSWSKHIVDAIVETPEVTQERRLCYTRVHAWRPKVTPGVVTRTVTKLQHEWYNRSSNA